MTWEDRKRAYDERESGNAFMFAEDSLTEEGARKAFKDGEKCSERRFARLHDRLSAVNTRSLPW